MGAMSPKQLQAVSCPTCGSGPKIMCKLSSGQPRKSAHRDRRLVAAEFWKTHPTAIEWLDWHFAIARCPLPRRYTYSTGGCSSLCARAVARLRWRQLPLYLFPNGHKEIGEDLVPDKRFRSGQAREPKRRPGGVCQGPCQSRRLSTGDTRPY